MMPKKLYFIAIELQGEIRREIEDLKKSLAQKYRARHALKTPPHITLQMPLRIEEEKENDLVSNLMKLDNSMSSGTVVLNNISSFEARTIFVEVKSNEFIVHLFNEVQQIMQSIDFIADKITHSSFHPHVTLMTRDLSHKMYKKAIIEISEFQFQQIIPIDRFQLYRHDGKFWRILKEFHLM